MQKTKWWAIILVVICTLFTSTAILFLKIGVMRINSISTTIFNIPLAGGLLLYVLAAILLIIALKFGELSVLYPAIATSFIWVNLFSIVMFNETISILRWGGMLFIIIGVGLIGFGSKTIRELQGVST